MAVKKETKNFLQLIGDICIYPTPPPQTRSNTRPIFQQSTAGLNSEFFFLQTGCLTKAKEPNLPYYLLIAEGRIDGFITLVPT